MTKQETQKQMATELGLDDFKEWCKANGCLGSDDEEYRAILKPLGMDMPPYMWLSGQAQFLYHQIRKAYDLGFARGFEDRGAIDKRAAAEDILAGVNSIERRTRQYENGEFTD